MSETSQVMEIAQAAKQASTALATRTLEQRNACLAGMAQALRDHAAEIVAANEADMAKAREAGTPAPLLDRLMLDDARIAGIADALDELASLPDPLGQVQAARTLSSGVDMQRVSVPLGVVAMVYEARPNVTADAAGICMKTGNAAILRGGSMAHESNLAMTRILHDAAVATGMPVNCIQAVPTTDRAATDELLCARGLVDVVIPRGGAGLIAHCVETATVPVIETGTGNCHCSIHDPANIEMARDIVINGKCQRPGVCNALESLLVDEAIASEALAAILPALAERGVEMVGDELAQEAGRRAGVDVGAATEEDWGTEYLDLKISIKCLTGGVEQAIAHINRYGTHHSECIVTDDEAAGEAFLAGVDAAAVYWNASTRFTDGGEFGLGAEIGISTQKLHARGPFALEALTSCKYVLRGTGQVRG